MTTKEDLPPCLSAAINTPRTFKMFKFNLIVVHKDNKANSVQMGELELRGDDNNKLLGAVASNPGGDNPNGEKPSHAIDRDDSTKWLDFKKGDLVLSFKTPQTVKDYRWRSANDHNECDPRMINTAYLQQGPLYFLLAPTKTRVVLVYWGKPPVLLRSLPLRPIRLAVLAKVLK